MVEIVDYGHRAPIEVVALQTLLRDAARDIEWQPVEKATGNAGDEADEE